MRRGAFFIATAAALTCSACLADHGKLEVRSIENGLKTGSQPVPYRIAEAYGQLALGNVALALEGFRKAAREDPASVDAYAGIAQCYDRMRRFDLSRHYYEQALAIAPRDGALLTRFAASLELQGLGKEAASVRHEMAMLAASAQPAPQDSRDDAKQLELAIATPPPLPAAPEAAAPVGKSVTIALAPPSAAQAKTSRMAIAPVGKSVTIALAPLPPAPPPSRQPRIERLSLTEVAIITGDGPRWERPQPVRSAARKPAQPVERMAAAPSGLRLLNAARIDRLAARTRTYLGRFGWREIIVGDAASFRSRSLILYPRSERAEASRLATRFGFPMAPRANVRQLTILLGRDAAGHPGLREGT